jgi:hypothetical protein
MTGVRYWPGAAAQARVTAHLALGGGCWETLMSTGGTVPRFPHFSSPICVPVDPGLVGVEPTSGAGHPAVGVGGGMLRSPGQHGGYGSPQQPIPTGLTQIRGI